MPRVDIQRYEHPESHGWLGNISTEQFIAFIAEDHMQLFNRDETGAAIGEGVTITL